MLNGQAPLIVFTFAPPVGGALFNAIAGIPIVGNRIVDNIGVPLPIYLDERISNLYVTGESRSIDVETETAARADGKRPKSTQWSLNSIVSISMIGSRDSAALSTLTSFCDLAFSQAVSKGYRISYFNKNVVVLGGLLHGFNAETTNEDDVVRVTLQISRGSTGGQVEEPQTIIERIRGNVPQ